MNILLYSQINRGVCAANPDNVWREVLSKSYSVGVPQVACPYINVSINYLKAGE
jgi:hypothetical protein